MCKVFCASLLLVPLLLAPARAQDTPAAASQPVSREEFEQLKKDNEELRQELAEIKRQQAEQAAKLDNQAAPATQPSAAAASPEIAELKQELAAVKKTQTEAAANSDQDAQDLDTRLKVMQDIINKDRGGLESVVIVGDANFGFSTQRQNASTFFADVSPLILWQPPDSHFLVETAFDLGIGGSDVDSETTTVTLSLADIVYDVCDNFLVGGGLFEVPFGQYHNHFDPPWIDKFPDDPIVFDELAPISEVGFFGKAALPVGTTRWTVDIYGANGPNLNTTDTAGSDPAAGGLNFDDFTDLNNNKAVGSRIGFLPFPDMEMGYSVQYSKPGVPTGFEDKVNAFLQAADFHYKPLVKSLDGQFDISAEWIWSDVGTATYDPTGALGFGPNRYHNFRQGGYASIGYRPTELDNKFLSKFEILGRYDVYDTPLQSQGGDRETRDTLGLDYWFTPYIVGKAAYEIDQKKIGPDQNRFIFQIGIGL